MISIKTEEFTRSLLKQIGIKPVPKIISVETTTQYSDIADLDYGFANNIYIVSRLTDDLGKLKFQRITGGFTKREFQIPTGTILVQEQLYPHSITIFCRPDELLMLPHVEEEINNLSLDEKIIIAVTGGFKPAYRFSEVVSTQQFYHKPQWTKKQYDLIVEGAIAKGIFNKNKSLSTKYRLIYNNNHRQFGLNGLIKGII